MAAELAILERIQRKVLWLATWMVHWANTRPNADGTKFGALASRYIADHGGAAAPGRVIVMVGDAELDEGNVWEALAEEAVQGLGRVLWIVDVNRQALDRVVPDARTRQLGAMFSACGWRVIELRWGRRLRPLPERHGVGPP